MVRSPGMAQALQADTQQTGSETQRPSAGHTESRNGAGPPVSWPYAGPVSGKAGSCLGTPFMKEDVDSSSRMGEASIEQWPCGLEQAGWAPRRSRQSLVYRRGWAGHCGGRCGQVVVALIC